MTITAIAWWNAASRDATLRLCDRLDWPRQYAEGEADHEWLTDEQFAQLLAVPQEWLGEIDADQGEAD